MFYKPQAPQPATTPRKPRALFMLMAVVAVVAVLLAPATAAPASASFSINTTDLMNQASDMFNQLWPVFAIIIGLSIGIALVGYIANKFMGAFKSAK